MEDKCALSVLDSLSNSSDIHQRKIADQTGLNLAKVNFVLKELSLCRVGRRRGAHPRRNL